MSDAILSALGVSAHQQRRVLSVSSVVSDSETPWTVAHRAPLSTEFSRQEYWSGLPFPSPIICGKDYYYYLHFIDKETETVVKQFA